MQKKLFFFHTFALVTAMAMLLAVNSGVLHVVMGYYQRRAIPAADERSQQARVVLDSWDEKDEDWDELSKRLRAADYDLVVCRDGEIVSSGLDQGQQEFFARMIQSASWPEEGTLTVQDSGVVLVGRQAGNYLLVALPHPGQPDGPGGFGGHRPQAEVMLISVFVSGLAAMGVIWLFSVVFARYQLRQIMRPVNALTAGAKRVEQGDLSTPIDYQGRDEFAAVCAAFDHMQRHLLEEREKNAAYERARTDLVAGISHDLRTPLTSMKGYIKGMRDGVANTPEKRERYLDIAYRKSCDMERLLQRLFYFSRLETGNLPLFLVDSDLNRFAVRFAREAGEELAASGGQVNFHPAAESLPVRVDEEQLLRVLNNLKENARRYARAQPLVLDVSVRREGNHACLRFADNGQGVPEEQLPHLFRQFWRGDQARCSQGGEGSGLGLYIVKYVVEAHGGTVTAENDGGLAVIITLPWGQNQKRRRPTAMSKILIVEDDPEIAMLERDYLEIEGFETQVTDNGQMAITQAVTGDYDLILLDLMLPGCSGYDVCRVIRDKTDVPILMVTARTESVDKIRGLGLGADDYVAKPFDPAELVARVKAHLARYQRLTQGGQRAENGQVIRVADVEIYPQSWKVYKAGRELKMPNREFELLKFLAEHPNIVFSKDRLFETIWGFDYVGDSATVTVHVGRIRDKIEDDPSKPRIIETVWGAGYRLNATG